MRLIYTGPDPAAQVGALPLPEGWPAYDHDEPDPEVARAKIASRLYEREKPQRESGR